MTDPAIPKSRLAALLAVAILGLSLLAGCSGDRPLPTPEITGVTLLPAEGDTPDTVLVTWKEVKDKRIEGYAIYRAEEGVGTTTGEKSEFVLEAITIALQYKDDELHVTERYPSTRYYYRISSIAEDGRYGPMSDEASILYEPMA